MAVPSVTAGGCSGRAAEGAAKLEPRSEVAVSACSPWAPGVLMGSAGLAGHVIILVAGSAGRGGTAPRTLGWAM